MTTRTVSKNRAIVFLTAQLFFAFALAVVFLPSAWAGEGLSTLRAKAEAGDPKAQNNLGLRYENAQGVPIDVVKAAYWFRLAAKQGYAEAQINLGVLYNVNRDVAKAAYWFRLAAKQGYAAAQNFLGMLYRDGGPGLPQNYAKAAYWFRLAAKQGYVDAQNDLGDLYATGGPGLPQDFSKAAYWHLLATGHH